MILQSEEQLVERAEALRQEIAEESALLVGKTIASVRAEYGPDASGEPLQCDDRGSWELAFTDGTKVRVVASYSDSGAHFERA